MKKMSVLIALLIIFVAAIYRYTDREMGEVSNTIKDDEHLVDKIDLPALKTKSGLDSKVTANSHKRNTTPKKAIKPPVPPEMENKIPQLTNESVGIKIIEEPDLDIEERDLEHESDYSELEADPIDDGVPDSYPIEDANVYYMPPEQRYPGNLGGPPPLNLPDPE